MSQITTELLFTSREDVFPNRAQAATGTVFLPFLLIKCFISFFKVHFKYQLLYKTLSWPLLWAPSLKPGLGPTHVLQRPRLSLIPLRALGLDSGREWALNPRPDRSCILWGERVATWHFPFDTDTGILIAAMIRQVVFQLWP